jgi:hypothetical protein
MLWHLAQRNSAFDGHMAQSLGMPFTWFCGVAIGKVRNQLQVEVKRRENQGIL